MVVMRVAIRTTAWIGLASMLTACAGSTDSTSTISGQCPQPRFTGKAPENIYNLVNPVTADQANIAAGRRLYEKDANPSCPVCHGIKGDGQGPLSKQFDPPPRNFACAMTVKGIPDGQLFWIVRNGSPGTSMPDFRTLRDEQIWQLVLHLRQMAR